MEYLILLNPGTRAAEILTNTHDFPETFTTYKAAKDFAEKYDVENYVIVAVCDDQKNYLV